MSSEAGTRTPARGDPPEAAIRAELERILASDVFSRSQQLRRFLSFIVEQRLAGQGDALKESVLAHELYRKGTDFDGGADPVVRVDARRLRDKLREYYEGRSEPVVISLPKGSYVPQFDENSVSPAASTDATDGVVSPRLQQMPPAVSAPLVPRLGRTTIAVSALAVVAVIVAALVWRSLPSPVSSPIQLLPLASYPGGEGPPALSPDGNLVAFAWSGQAETGPTDIYVKAVASEALRQLTATPDSESSPAWSPDGHSIAFVRNGNGVFTMSQLGGAERQVSASGTHVAWAGDSKSVLIRDRERETGPLASTRYSSTRSTVASSRKPLSVPETTGLKSHRMAKPWRSYVTRRWESRTCSWSPWQAANRSGSRTGTTRCMGYRGRPMVRRLSTMSTRRLPVGCGGSL